MADPIRITTPNTTHLYSVSAWKEPPEGCALSYERFHFEVEANNRNQAARLVQKHGEGFIVCDVNMIG